MTIFRISAVFTKQLSADFPAINSQPVTKNKLLSLTYLQDYVIF